jgi:hypothetical protein
VKAARRHARIAHEFAENSHPPLAAIAPARVRASVLVSIAQAIYLFVGRHSLRAFAEATLLARSRRHLVKKRMRSVLHAAMFRRARERGN